MERNLSVYNAQTNFYPTTMTNYTTPYVDYFQAQTNYAPANIFNNATPSSKTNSSEDDDDESQYSSTKTETSTKILSAKRRIRTVPSEEKDSAYYEKRARNNESAKRSRDARRFKEQQIQERLVFLEHEHSRLLMENQTIRYQLAQLQAFSQPWTEKSS